MPRVSIFVEVLMPGGIAPEPRCGRGIGDHCAGQHRSGLRTGIGFCQRAVDIDPTYASAYAWLSAAYAAQSIFGFAAASEAFLRSRSAARKAIDLEPDGRSSFFIAAAEARLGEKDKAFEWLERAFEERAGLLIYLKIHPMFDELREDPRFEVLVSRIGIPA